jgi:hypothetical protein
MMNPNTEITRSRRLQQRCESYRLASSYSSHENDQRLVTEMAQASPSLAAQIASRLTGTNLYTRRILRGRLR